MQRRRQADLIKCNSVPLYSKREAQNIGSHGICFQAGRLRSVRRANANVCQGLPARSCFWIYRSHKVHSHIMEMRLTN
jgi:hypothetical protein